MIEEGVGTVSTSKELALWRSRIPLINSEAARLHRAGYKGCTGALTLAVQSAILRLERRTVGKSSINHGLKIVWDEIDPICHEMHKTFTVSKPGVLPTKIRQLPLKKDVASDTAPAPEAAQPTRYPTPDELAESIYTLLQTKDRRIAALESENQAQADLLNESEEEAQRLKGEIARLRDEVERAHQKRSDLTQRLAASTACVVGGD